MVRQEKFHITSPESAGTRVVIEPWGMVYTVQPGSTFEVTFEGPDEGKLELEEQPGSVRLYGWPGSIYSAVQNGKVIEDSSGPVPSLPPGMTVQTFAQLMFHQATHEQATVSEDDKESQ